jgi:O-antigen/teichoic acid export membrane protein
MTPASDHRTLLSGTALNVAGLAAGVIAAYGVQLVFARQLPTGGLGLVTVAVQVAFVAAAGSRFGMDLATVREVAIGVGAADRAHLRSLVERCALVAGAASVVVGIVLVAVAPLTGGHRDTIAIAAVSVPFAAVANTYLGATRGLKQMSQTLWVYWIGQPLAWIAIAVAAIALGGGTNAAVWSYDASWLLAALAAWRMWRRAAAGMGDEPAGRDRVRAALRFGAPRAPSALLAQALFWADLWVLAAYAPPTEVDTYSAASRLAQVVLLFLTSLNLLFSPFAADLHARGHRESLDALFKSATRWALAATIPVVIVLCVAAPDALRAFGPGYEGGETTLRILLIGQLVNAATGSVGFILIMVGKTGLDLLDNAVAVAVLVGLAAPLASSHGMEGAAIAAAVAIGGVNLIRLVQVHRIVDIQPYSADYLWLLVPAAACAAAALAAQALTGDSRWWFSLLVVGAAGVAAYVVVAPVALTGQERSAMQGAARRITNRSSR